MKSPSFVDTLSGRLMLFGVVPTMLALGAIVTATAVESFRDLRQADERLLGKSAEDAAAELSALNERCNSVAAVMAQAQVNGLFGLRKASSDFARSVALTVPRIIGAYVIYEPNADGQDAAATQNGDVPPEALGPTGRFVPYWYFDSGSSATGATIRLKPNTDMETLEYYVAPKERFEKSHTPAATLTEPYLYEGVLMVSHTYPIVSGGRFVGIVGVDRGLDTLAKNASRIKARLGVDVFVLSGGGRFITATTDGAIAAAGAERLQLQELDKSPYGELGPRWNDARVEGRPFEAVDPVLREPCIYATATAQVGGWKVVTRRTKADVLRAADAAVRRNTAIGSLGIAVVGGLMFFVTRRVAGRVRLAAEAADRIARGDLTRTVEQSASRDESGQLMRSMNTMDGNLNALVGNVKQASIRLNSTATEIAATSRQQEASSATFGAASNQIAAAVKEISATGRDLVKTMESVNRMAAETATLAGSGQASLQGMEGVMRDLDGATASIADKLNAINERSQRITGVVTTITKVADQTNILSINAAIEAEKAGEYGAGFLVIAREIRRLADQTASATLDIEQMVQQMQGAVSSGVMEMDRFADQVRRGVREVATAGGQLTEIIDRVNRSTESFKQVNESMQAQSEGAQQISEAMASLVANANQTVQSVKEFSLAAADLQAAIALLRDAVSQFKLRELASSLG